MEQALKEKIVATTSGTKTGAILRCALGLNRTTGDSKGPQTEVIGPAFIGKASVTSDGYVMCNYIDRDGTPHMGAFVGSVSDLDDNLKHVRNFMGLTAEQYNALTAAVADWIATDYRPKQERG